MLNPVNKYFSIANLLRDLWWDASDSKIDAYFVSLDFKKAFDSIDQRWLSRVLQKMNFPTKFIRTIIGGGTSCGDNKTMT